MENKQQRVRSTAYKVPINALINGRYVKDEAEFSPNYIQLNDLKISRANIIGIVVSIEDNSNISFVLDDGTAKIPIRSFEQISSIPEIKIGSIINVIGRPREFSSEKYIVPEIIKETDEKWMRVRKLEIGKISLPEEQKEQANEMPVTEEKIENNQEGILSNQEKIIQYIKKNDQGQGIEIENIINNLQIDNCEKLVENMLKEGDLFENLPGKLRVLE